MGRKVFALDPLSQSSIKKLKNYLEEYRMSLPKKCKSLVQRLSEIGLNVASIEVNQSVLKSYIHLFLETQDDTNGGLAILVMQGEVLESDFYEPFYTALVVEFGAGIKYNKNGNPLSDKFGFGVGTFPGQTHAFNENGWYFWDEKTQTWKHSYGVKATMPMYNAFQSMFVEVENIAKEVFL